MESTEDVENIQARETENTEIETEIIRRVKEEIGIVQDQERKNTEREEKVDQILQENEYTA
jgi:hypothetical protein